MPSSRALGIALLGTLALAFAAVAPGLAAAALVLDVLLVVALLVDAARARRIVLRVRRVWPPVLVQGVTSAIEVRILASGATRLVLREALHPALAEGPLRTEIEVSAAAEAAWSYPLRPRRRGEHQVGPLSVRVLGPWGLAWSQRDVLGPEPRRVYPQIRWEGRLGRLLLLAHRRELGRSPLRLRGVGTEPYGVREYRPGDAPSRIHWKATARRGRLITREDVWERGAPLVLLLDCARAMRAREGERSKLDHALAAALALARVAVGRGDRVSIIAFADRVDRVVRVRPGADGIARAYAGLYDVEARLAEPAYDLAAEAVRRTEARRSTVVLLTSVVDLAAGEVLREALCVLRRRHRTVLVNLEDPEIARLALGSPATEAEAFAKVSALEILLGNRRLGRSLGRAGIRAVSAPADTLAWEALSAYLSVARERTVRR